MSLGGGTQLLESENTGIDVSSVSHRFEDRGRTVTALQNIDLEIPAGEFVSLVGVSGCGKTTLLDLLTGLLELQSGAITLAGRTPEAGRSDTARMFARDALLPWRTASENIEFALATRDADIERRRSKISDLLSAVGLTDFADSYPSQLSQGMRQRVAIARTFSLESQFIFLDEPFGALDAMTKIALQSVLINLWEKTPGTSVILVTHDLGEAVALSDRVIVLSPRPGRIIADVAIDLPRPRDVRMLQTTARFHELTADVWKLLDSQTE